MKSQSGRTILEMLAVLAIMGILSVAGVKGFSLATKKHRANELLHEANKRAVVLSSQILTGKEDLSFGGFDEVSGGTFGEPTYDAQEETISIPLTGVDPDVSKQMKVTVGSSAIMTITDADATGTSLILTFNKDLSRNVDGPGNGGCPSNAICMEGEEGFNCKAGYTLNDGGTGCVACAKGWYKTSSGNDACTQCLDGKTTRSTGATSSDECIMPCNVDHCETCENGSSLACATCENGYFLGYYPENGGAPEYGCHACPANSWTAGDQDHAVDSSQVLNMDTGAICYCDTGYVAYNYTCIPGSTCSVSNCSECESGNSNSCVTCNAGYAAVLTAQGTICDACPSNSWTESDAQHPIDSATYVNPMIYPGCYCYKGYYSTGGGCSACPEHSWTRGDEQHAVDENQSLDAYYAGCYCDPNYTVSGSGCVSAPSCNVSNCSTCEAGDPDSCGLCDTGYYRLQVMPGASSPYLCTACPENSSTSGNGVDETQPINNYGCYCNSGYYAYNGSCIVAGMCNVSNCSTCEAGNPNSCGSCDTGYYRLQIMPMPSEPYYCNACPENSSTADANVDATQPVNNYGCYCNTGYYATSGGACALAGACDSSVMNCTQCENGKPYSCSVCDTGYYRLQIMPMPSEPYYCNACPENSSTSGNVDMNQPVNNYGCYCNSGYYATSGGACTLAGACDSSVTNCSQCENGKPYSCSVCDTGYYRSQVMPMPSEPYFCSACPANSSTSGNGVDTTQPVNSYGCYCNTGYYATSGGTCALAGACDSSVTNCSQCANGNPYSCNVCNAGYYRSQVMPGDPSTSFYCSACPANSSTSGNGVDTTQPINGYGCYCNSGYYAYGGSCVAGGTCSVSNCSTCETGNPNSCNTCNVGYFLVPVMPGDPSSSYYCEACPANSSTASTAGHTVDYNEEANSQGCYCYQGYSSDGGGSCIPTSTCSVSNCETCVSGNANFCQKCLPGYEVFVGIGTCSQCTTSGDVQCGGCPSATPYWNGSTCVECRFDGNCGSSSGIYCNNGTCTNCVSNGSATCQRCVDLAQGGGAAGNYWNGSSCVECVTNSNCASGTCTNGTCATGCPEGQEPRPYGGCGGCSTMGDMPCAGCPSATPYWNGSRCVECVLGGNCSGYSFDGSIGYESCECRNGTCNYCSTYGASTLGEGAYMGDTFNVNGTTCHCQTGKTWSGSACVTPAPTCNVQHCVTCETNDSMSCATCEEGYIRRLVGAGMGCVSCTVGQSCSACPSATPYWNGTSCYAPCNVEHCLTCETNDSMSCATCESGYIRKLLGSGMSCVSCPANSGTEGTSGLDMSQPLSSYSGCFCKTGYTASGGTSCVAGGVCSDAGSSYCTDNYTACCSGGTYTQCTGGQMCVEPMPGMCMCS